MATAYPVTKAGLGLVPHRLHDALTAAHVPFLTVVGSAGDTATVLGNTGGLQTQINAVVTALDPTALTVSEQAAATDTATVSDLTGTYQAMLDGLGTIAGHMDQILAGPATPTAAQAGAALKLLAGDLKAMTQGQTRLLKVLRLVVQRAGG